MTDLECPECHKEMAIIILDEGIAYDECECGTVSETYVLYEVRYR